MTRGTLRTAALRPPGDGLAGLLGRAADLALAPGAGFPDPAHEPDDALAAARAALEERIAGNPGAWGATTLLSAIELLAELDAAQEARELDAQRKRIADLRRVRTAVDALRDLPAAEAVDRAPVELAAACDFGRSMVSSVVGSMWLPGRLHISEDSADHADAFLDFVRGARIPLRHTLLETELVRRRMPALVEDPIDDGRTFKDIIRASRTAAYVVAPITARDRVIGFLHADRLERRRRVTDADLDRIAAFASAFGLLHEQQVLRERLGVQRRRFRGALAETEAALERLEQARLELDESLAPPGDAPVARDRGPKALPRIASVLTVREREVLALLADGRTNAGIAQELVIAEGTVKAHVKSILRKLRVPSRAAAVARYARQAQR
ncbi:LuxR C-terminal-related transcriptional regulator [Patulibacter sp. NPDC049589]|uniref:helix-turn-helix transcriptional regulator n=1 Tax=Patulibacter sp. NPDC049589 TaxID=3154731 RepID=UPI003447EED4